MFVWDGWFWFGVVKKVGIREWKVFGKNSRGKGGDFWRKEEG